MPNLQAILDLDVACVQSLAEFARKQCYTITAADADPPSELMLFPDIEHGTWAFLRPVGEAIQNDDNVIVSKSRRLLASWLFQIGYMQKLLFQRNRTIGEVSESEDMVDDGSNTCETLFGKLRILKEHLPPHLTGGLTCKHMQIYNSWTNSVIKGFPGKKNAGRGGTWTNFLFDELPHIWWANLIYGSVRQACPRGLAMVGTPNQELDIGEDPMSRLMFDPKQTRFKIIELDWSMHPERDQAWYDEQCLDMTPRQIASELDRNWGKGLAGGRCFYPWRRSEMTGEVPHIPGIPVYRTWDFGVGVTSVVTMQLQDLHTEGGHVVKQFRVIDLLEASEQPYGFYRDALAKDPERYDHSEIIDIGDPYMQEQRDSSLYSWGKNLRRPEPEHPYGIKVLPAHCVGVSPGNLIDNVCRFMRTHRMPDGSTQPGLVVREDLRLCIQHIEAYSRPTDRAGQVRSDKPNKDKHSHCADAIEYLIWHLAPPKGRNGGRNGGPLTIPQSVELKEFAAIGPSTELGDWLC